MSPEREHTIRSGHEAVKKAGLTLADGGKISADTFHHEEVMDQMIKVIEFCRMDRKMRAVMLLRLIHGYTIQRMQMHLFLHGHLTGNSHDELEAIEAAGKKLMREVLNRHTIQEIIESINAKPSIITGLRNELTTPKFGLS